MNIESKQERKMSATARHMIQAIMSVSHEIKELKAVFGDLKELVMSARQTEQLINTFKNQMDSRFTALQYSWEKHLNNHLYNQEHLIKRLLSRRDEKAIVKKRKKKLSTKKKVKK